MRAAWKTSVMDGGIGLMGTCDVVEQVQERGLVAVIRGARPDQAFQRCQAAIDGGLDIVEVALTVPDAPDVIRDLTSRHRDTRVLVGAGTVFDARSARAAIAAGATFLVSPSLETTVAAECAVHDVPYVPGAGSVTEVVRAIRAGARIVKVFPGEVLGPAFIRAVRGPLPDAALMPTGGVSLDNVGDWLDSGAVAVGVGSALIAGAAEDDYAAFRRTAECFVEAVRSARA